MSDLQENNFANQAMSAKDDNAKTNALIAYVLMMIGLFTGIFWLVGAIWAMVKKTDAQGSIFEDHYTNIIKIFWWGLVWSILGLILVFVVVGYFILLIVWIWAIYKIVKGFARITSNKAYNS